MGETKEMFAVVVDTNLRCICRQFYDTTAHILLMKLIGRKIAVRINRLIKCTA